MQIEYELRGKELSSLKMEAKDAQLRCERLSEEKAEGFAEAQAERERLRQELETIAS